MPTYFLTTVKDKYRPRYVGKTMYDPSRRLRQHVYAATRLGHKRRVNAWIMSRIVAGFEIISCKLDSDGSNEVEVHWIKTLRDRGEDLLNVTNGGDGGPMPPEVVEKTRRTKALRTYPKYIGPRGERSGKAKLTEEDVRNIRKEYVPNIMTAKMLSKKYGVGWKAIQKIIHRARWAHVD